MDILFTQETVNRLVNTIESKNTYINGLIDNYFLTALAELHWRYDYRFAIDATYGTFGWYVNDREVQPNNFGGYCDEDGNEYPFSEILREGQRLWVSMKEYGHTWQNVMKTDSGEFNEFVHGADELQLFIDNTEYLHNMVSRAVHDIGRANLDPEAMKESVVGMIGTIINDYCVDAYKAEIGDKEFSHSIRNIVAMRLTHTHVDEYMIQKRS